MATPWGLTCLFIGLNTVEICNAHPMEQLLSGSEGPNGQIMGALVAVMVSVCIVLVLVACVCCKRRSGFKENETEKKVFRNSPVSATVINETSLSEDDPGHVNPIASPEFTIFTPLSPPHHNNNVFRSQSPVTCYTTENESSPKGNKVVNPQIDGIDVSDWFADTEHDFPRSRLKYTRELGTGWFGRVVEGEAHGIDASTPENPAPAAWTPVAVRILESSASAHEQAQFLHEAAVYRAGAHPHLLQLLGRSLEATPLLLIQELCPRGDLKRFLLENRECKDNDLKRVVPIRFCCQLAAAVEFLHDKNLPHLDLAARSCQISPDLSLKLGDYGLGVTHYPNDYYQGTPSIPVRWCAPESINHTNTTLQPKQITLAANIWSLAVTFWEICEWGRLPYDWLTDDEVVSQVMDTPHTRLPQPTFNADYYIPPLYRLMEYCWLPSSNRPQINQIYSMLIHLSKTYTSSPSTQPETNDFSLENFDLRWESFKPNTIIKTDNKSASLSNVHGSFENLTDGVSDTVIQMDSWLENVATHTGDMQYVRGLIEAIHELDTALASEQTSSSSSFEPTPNCSLGPARSDTVIHMDDSSNLDSFIYLPKRSESESETEDETWRRRIERGAYSEKVKQKSKSVADLMVLTHIDMNTVKDIFQEELKKLHEERRESLLFVPVQNSEQISQIANVNINQDSDLTHDKVINLSKPKEELFSELEVTTSSFVEKESLIKKSSENNLLKSSVNDNKESSLDIETLINKTVPSVSDSKLVETLINEPEIKLVESNRTETTNEENFDTFLQHEPVLNKIDAIESKETVILSRENKNIEVTSNTNQSMLSNETLTKNELPETIVSTTNDKVQEINNLSQDVNRYSEHMKPISINREGFSLIQDFINNEKINEISPVQNEIDESIENKLQSKSIEENTPDTQKESAIITTQISESIPQNKYLESEIEQLQLKEEVRIIAKNKVDEIMSEAVLVTAQRNELLQENKIVSEISDSDIKLEIILPKEIDEISVHPMDLEFNDNNKIILEEKKIPDKITESLKTEKILTVENKLDDTDKKSTTEEKLEETNKKLTIDERLEKTDDKIDENKVETNENTIMKITTDFLLNEIVTSDNKQLKHNKNNVTESVSNSALIPELIKNKETLTTDKLNTIVSKVEETIQIPQLQETIEENLTPSDEISKIIMIPENKDPITSTVPADILEDLMEAKVEKLTIKDEIIETNIPEYKEATNVSSDLYKDLTEIKLQVNDKEHANIQNSQKEETPSQEVQKLEEIVNITPETDTTNILLSFEVIPTENSESKIDKEDTEIKKVQNLEEIANSESGTTTTNILLSFDEIPTESNETKSEEPKQNLEEFTIKESESQPIVLDEEITEPLTAMPDLIDTLNKELVSEISNTRLLDFEEPLLESKPKELENKEEGKIIADLLIESPTISPNINPVISVKANELSSIQNFINNERNNNLEDLISPEVKPEVKVEKENNSNSPQVSSDLTSDLLDTSNVQQINQIFNVFSVTVDHKPPIECFSPVKNYYAPFDQNDLMTDINTLLESEKKYESKNSVCTSSLQNDFLPFVNGISSELSGKIVNILDGQPKKLSEIVLDSLKNCEEEKIVNGHEERPKKLSEIVLDSLKTNSISEDSGFASVQCEEKIMNGHKDSSDTSEDILKISSVDSLDDILSNSEENLADEEIGPKKLSELALENLKNNSRSPDELVTSFVEEEIEENAPKKLSEIVQESLNKTVNLPDIILDNLQNKTFVKDQNEDILINIINDSPMKSLNSENSESAIEDTSDKNSPQKLSEIILDSLPCNSPVTSESTDNVSDKTVIEVKLSENSAPICDDDSTEAGELESPKFPTSTPFKTMPKKTDPNESFFSFVSEGDDPSDCQTHVILGPCEEYGLGLYSGLKTTFGKFADDDRPEEELLQFSSNFMPYTDNTTTENSVDYSLETWDKFLGKSLPDQNDEFGNFSPKHDKDVFKKEPEVKKEELNKTVTLVDKKNEETFTIENEAPASDTNLKEDESETTQSSWEPGEGWFLHPQSGADNLTGEIDISGSDTIDNSYVGFAIDEECVNALRNELAAKLPHAQGMLHEELQEPEEWDNEERNEIIVKYNVYAAPLSPIPEESCCDDVYCDQIQHRDGSDSESDWSEPGLGQTSQLDEDILIVDTETHTALILESPSLREPQHRHTPSQDSCCSNDTLFNLEDLNYGLSPQHHGSTSNSEQVLEIEITEDTPKQSPTIPKIEENPNSDSTEMNLTYTKPDITIETENQNDCEASSKAESPKTHKLELKLDPNAFAVAPLPSPEDIPWRQLPASLLTYNEVVQDKFEIQDSEQGPTIENEIDQDEDLNPEDFNQEDYNLEDMNLPPDNPNDDLSDSVRDIDADLYSNLTDIRFPGPCDAQLMSTSFSESVDYAEERDWDSGSDTRSSSSGEFIWKEGEHEESLRALHAASHDVGVTEEINPMDIIEEENSSGDSDDCEDMEETEFVPSAWDAQATPTKSALRSPEKSTKRKNQQKGVWFKKQKYHCVYEYPREPESPVAPPSDLWRPLSDLSTFSDWELDPESCVAPVIEDTADSYDVLDKYISRNSYPLTSGSSRHRDLYQLNPFPDFGAGLSGSEEDFFISSSARPFQTIGQSSQFFPGQQTVPPKSKFLWQDYQSSSQQSSRDLSEGITPDSGIDDVTPASSSESALVDILPSRNQNVPPLKCLAAIAANKTPPAEQKSVDSSLGVLRHTRNRLKLDLPPSPNAFTSNRTFSVDVPNDPVINREIPTFTTFGKSRFSVQHVATPTDENSDPLQSGKPKIKNVSFEALPHKPMALTEQVYIMDKSEEETHKPVEMVQGEASLLDSADEDSGIESSANATLERQQQQIPH